MLRSAALRPCAHAPPRSRQFELYHASRESFVYLRQFYMVGAQQPTLVRLEKGLVEGVIPVLDSWQLCVGLSAN